MEPCTDCCLTHTPSHRQSSIYLELGIGLKKSGHRRVTQWVGGVCSVWLLGRCLMWCGGCGCCSKEGKKPPGNEHTHTHTHTHTPHTMSTCEMNLEDMTTLYQQIPCHPPTQRVKSPTSPPLPPSAHQKRTATYLRDLTRAYIARVRRLRQSHRLGPWLEMSLPGN